jgi:type I restriction enzyme R subunit
VNDLEHGNSGPNDQQRLVAGMLDRDNLLDIIRTFSMKGIPQKLRKITDTFLESRGIAVKVKPISILDEDFEKGIKSHSRTKTKAAEIEHAIRHHLDVDLDDDPELRASFAEELNAILEEFRDNWDHISRN